MAISYNAGTNTLTVTGAGNTMAAIFAADVAGGWGVVSRAGDYYLLACNLTVGDGSTVTDITDTVGVQIGTAAANKSFLITARATFQLGTLSNGTYTTDYGTNGRSLVLYPPSSYQDSSGTLILYGCSVIVGTTSYHVRMLGVIDIRNCSFGGAGCIWFYTGVTGQMRRCTMTAVNYGLLCYSAGVTFEDMVIESPTYGIALGTPASMSARDVKVHEDTTRHVNIGSGAGINPTMWLFDCDFDPLKVYTYGTDKTYVLDHKSLSIEVLDEEEVPIEGAKIDIVDNVDEPFTDWDDDLIAYWPLHGSGVDLGPNGYDFTTISGASSSEDRWGKDGRALYFDGNDYMDTSATGIILHNYFTISMWFKKASGVGTLLAHYNNASPYTGLRIGQPTSGANINLWTSDGVAGIDSNLGALGDDVWHHLVLAMNGVYLELWVDGRYIWSGNISRAYGVTTNVLRLGREFAADRYLTGYLSEIFIWDKVLTHRQIASLYCYQRPYFETDSNGQVSAQNMKRLLIYNSGAGAGMGTTYNTFRNFSPLNYTIQAPGFSTLKGVLSLDEPSELRVAAKLQRIQGGGAL